MSGKVTINGRLSYERSNGICWGCLLFGRHPCFNLFLCNRIWSYTMSKQPKVNSPISVPAEIFGQNLLEQVHDMSTFFARNDFDFYTKLHKFS